MNNYTIVCDNFNENEILNELIDISKEISASFPHFYSANGRITSSSWSPTTVDKNIKNGLSHIIRRIFLDACEKSEKLLPGSADITLALSIRLAINSFNDIIINKDNFDQKNIEDDSKSFLNLILRRAKPITGKTISDQIGNAENLEIETLVLEAIRWGGMISKFEVKESLTNDASVVVTSGFNFDLSPDERVLFSPWTKENVRLFLIDGLVENVSEIHHLLTKANEEKAPVIILARGFSDDVINTLAVNRQRGVLDVIPIKTPYDEIHANTLKDISCVIGSNVISSLTGDLISMRKFDELPIVKKVSCLSKKIIITTTPSSSLKSHIVTLQELRETSNEEKKSLYDKRLRSLVNSLTTIEVPKRIKTGVELTTQTIKIMSAFLSSGLVDLNEIRNFSLGIFNDPIDFTVKTTRKNLIPASHLINAVKLSSQITKELTSIGTIILLD